MARKWRPRDFSALVGQEHVVRALTNGLEQGRLHHAFLLTGTRGVGKTTIARILAKALNCEQGVTAQPCGQCANCVAIDEGRFVDLIEIDAASRTRVDDTREILDNVQYAPARGRYKIYLIDEVHMLSTHSFNALLKTLEEPPEHVKFVLATTDPQKIPITILSRCLQFSLRRLTPDEIAAQLEHILEAEQAERDPQAVALLARAADGSMRDALSLLDQALAVGGGRINAQLVQDMLGTVEMRHLHGLLQALIDRNPAQAMATVQEAFALSRDLSRLLADLCEMLHRIAMVQVVPDYRDESDSDWAQIESFAQALDPEDVQLYYQIAATGRRDLGLAPSPRVGVEMTLLRMFAFQPAGEHGTAGGTGPRRKEGVRSRSGPDRGAAPAQTSAPRSAEPSTVYSESPPAQAGAGAAEQWAALLNELEMPGPMRALGALLELAGRDGDRFEFKVARDDLEMISERFRKSLSEALGKRFGERVSVRIQPVREAEMLKTPAALAEAHRDRSRRDAQASVDADPVIQTLKQEFGARIVPGSVRELDS